MRLYRLSITNAFCGHVLFKSEVVFVFFYILLNKIFFELNA